MPPMRPQATLLPPGFADTLPFAAEREAALVHGFLETARRRGYRYVKPPLCEFADGVDGGANGDIKGAAAVAGDINSDIKGGVAVVARGNGDGDGDNKGAVNVAVAVDGDNDGDIKGGGVVVARDGDSDIKGAGIEGGVAVGVGSDRDIKGADNKGGGDGVAVGVGVGGDSDSDGVSLFRFLDPVSHRMLVLRDDITRQAARMATERLGALPRPLRLCYAGEVLRASARQIDHEREFLQLGAEIFGAEGIDVEGEILTLAVAVLGDRGLAPLTVDLAWPRFARELARERGLDSAATLAILKALETRDASALSRLADGEIFASLLSAAGRPADALAAAEGLRLSPLLGGHLDRLAALADLLASRCPGLSVGIDLAESRGFGFQTGLGFSIFSAHARTEIARGGSYLARGADGTSEAACGFSAYSHLILRALEDVDENAAGNRNSDPAARRIFAAVGASETRIAELRAAGHVVIAQFAADKKGDDNRDDKNGAVNVPVVVKDDNDDDKKGGAVNASLDKSLAAQARAQGCAELLTAAGLAPLQDAAP
ncbi:MAG: ATP phosphoribosyltransferase regulatory subunit [Alphaproteobacteria bacterium]|nr:ATP phosphoribosyltransferase regulatory subunit [Alphaproteobacteria bacterium]